jgi:uncharacterized protein (DUF433 family)
MSVDGPTAIEKTPNVCGGAACIRQTRIAVWMLVVDRKLGMTDADVLNSFPSLTTTDLDAAWSYYRERPVEIEQAIWFNDTSANVPDGEPPPAWVIVSGRMLGLSDEAIREAFVPPLSTADLDRAWVAYRTDYLARSGSAN